MDVRTTYEPAHHLAGIAPAYCDECDTIVPDNGTHVHDAVTRAATRELARREGSEVRSADLVLVHEEARREVTGLHRMLVTLHDQLTAACESRLERGESVADLLEVLSRATALLIMAAEVPAGLDRVEDMAYRVGQRAGREQVKARTKSGGRGLPLEAISND